MGVISFARIVKHQPSHSLVIDWLHRPEESAIRTIDRNESVSIRSQ